MRMAVRGRSGCDRACRGEPCACCGLREPGEFPGMASGFRREAAAQGISPQTISALDGLTYDPATIAKDRGQAVFAQSFLQFSDRMVSNNRLQVGAALLKRNAAPLPASSRNSACRVRCWSPFGDWRPISAR